jgi:pyruvate formate lyase activating enzyme
MLIGGLQKFTALDYPGKIAATVFTVGCNFRCPFCHNPEIVEIDSGINPEAIKEADVLEFLVSRRGELDGVCITGGEPTLQADLIRFMERVKDMGFLLKLDTNGFNTQIVKNIIEKNLVDYFAIDIKTAFDKYHLVSAPVSARGKILETVNLIIENEIPLELRTTVVPGIVEVDDFDKIVEDINLKNPEILKNLIRYSVQGFRPQKCLDKKFEKIDPYEDEILEEIAEKMRNHCERVDVLK